MKIGIITWFNGGNYGTNLQAIALQSYLRSNGYSVELIDFEIDVQRKEKRTLLAKILSQPLKYATKYAEKKYYTQIQTRYNRMASEVRENCMFTKVVMNEQDYIDTCNQFDVLICGSDQIWNPNWYHRFYYADYDQIKAKRISYAPSLGVNVLREEQKEDLARSLSKFDAISVREYRGANLIKPLVKSKPKVVVDPTLLLTAKAWDELFSIETLPGEKYILSMFLTDNHSHWCAARAFAKSKSMKHIVIPYCGFSYFQNAEIKADASVRDFLKLIRGAEYVLTDSFHVTVFSLIYKRQFYTFERFVENEFTSQNERIRNILEISSCQERLILYGTKKIEEKEDIDYMVTGRCLTDEIERSKQFLSQALEDFK